MTAKNPTEFLSKVVKSADKSRPPNAGRGRIKGVPNKVTREVKEAILNAFTKVGGEDYLAVIAKDNPSVFCALLGKVLPMQVTGEDGGAVQIRWMK